MTASRPQQTRRRPGLERVLVTADRLFYEGGLHATGVDLIAAEAKVSKATMYTYFATKDELIVEYLRSRSAAWQSHVRDQLDRSDGTPLDNVLMVYELLGKSFGSAGFRGCPFINAEAESATDAAHQVTLAHRAWVRDLFAGLLSEVGALEGDEITELAQQLVAIYDGAMVGAHAEPDRDWGESARLAARTLVMARVGAALT